MDFHMGANLQVGNQMKVLILLIAILELFDRIDRTRPHF